MDESSAPLDPHSQPTSPEPDDKDWTWVLERPCPDCGFDAGTTERADIPDLVRGVVDAFEAALALPDAAQRPHDAVWSTLEYACHVRDVCGLFDGRLQLMLAEDDPEFANWDQDETALAERYWAQDPEVVAVELRDAGEAIAGSFAAVSAGQWARPGRRSNGSVFTVDSFARYFVHDLLHHVHDIAANGGD